jgi:2Fe-2S ferredoxin
MPTVTFLPMGLRASCAEGETVFAVGRRSGVPIATSCVGKGTCGLCRVKIVAGEEHLPSFGGVDRKHLGNVYFLTKVRLACQAVVTGDVVVEVPGVRKLG